MSDGMAIGERCRIATTRERLLHADLVLIVDDDEDILELAAEIFQTLGYAVLTAQNGLEALAVLRETSRISTLFTDIQMPGMGGGELAEVAVALRPDMDGLEFLCARSFARERRAVAVGTAAGMFGGIEDSSRASDSLASGFRTCSRRSRAGRSPAGRARFG
jgi:CheY-like chemotaxis protein